MSNPLSYPLTWVILSVNEDGLDSESVTRELDLNPDFSTPITATDKEGKLLGFGHWQLHSTLGAQAPLEDHILQILEKVQPSRHKVKEFATKHSLCMYVSVEFSDSTREETEISSRLLLLLGNLGIKLVFQPWKRD
ncbi:PF14106 domain protein [Leptospira santarosai str. CBC1416]|uniref:PF14106 domain protein n=6 Tax=Leptospira santarosai TaxID=28183 RepID=A0A0G8BJ85_9LEPT|nr:DUF4279 domain-containing protein [Leptospira santarosai]EKO35696.1 PF14106 domain protein [Leptospira santarosai str. MOR084]EKO76382.1 PF14106 domain protein [Leptospira sp. Fiocruz LV3954]EKR90596.1 PF14106 domain protein [Leptospira santarosai str. CBC379]EKS07808.1 PF14106 domain protein [Leptospira santarosai str. JET]EKT87185.1 hypothetical protein LSS_08739 [Leptospira santarosai serovar Shermani str. LT 821]EMF90950.1 PF14106 domain protein [Leptospira santarosai str. ST188]EMI70